jgi:hypothetical protein
VSEQQAEATQGQTQGESGSVSAGSTVSPSSEPSSEAAAAADLAASVLAAPAIAPDHESLPKDEVKPEVAPEKVEAPVIELPTRNTPRGTGKVLIMAPSDRTWHDHSADVKVDAGARAKAAPRIEHKADLKSDLKTEQKARRSFPAMAAMLALATIAGAVGGALATTGLTHVADAAATTPAPASNALEASIARIDSDVVALKAGLEHTSKAGLSQFNKTSDRLDKIEKAQAEPNAKLARLTEAVDKLRAEPHAAAAAPVQAAAVTPAAAKDVTGSVTTPAGAAPLPVQMAAAPAQVAAAPTAPAKPEVGRMPSVDGWKLSDVGYGGALIENRRGTYEVYAGDFIPGLGRIDAIRKQDGHWVVITSKGLITSR